MRLIDADELKEIINQYECYDQVLDAPTIQAIPIPKGATNGDMIKTMFSNMEVANDREWFVHLQDHKGNIIKISKDWWDAKYEE